MALTLHCIQINLIIRGLCARNYPILCQIWALSYTEVLDARQ
jgi:hypothetical protein